MIIVLCIVLYYARMVLDQIQSIIHQVFHHWFHGALCNGQAHTERSILWSSFYWLRKQQNLVHWTASTNELPNVHLQQCICNRLSTSLVIITLSFSSIVHHFVRPLENLIIWLQNIKHFFKNYNKSTKIINIIPFVKKFRKSITLKYSTPMFVINTVNTDFHSIFSSVYIR